MLIRTFKNPDATQVRNLIRTIFGQEFFQDQKAYPETDLENILQSYGKLRETFFVLEDSGRIVGTVGVKEDSNSTALLRRFFVDPSCRGQGYGSMLVSMAIEFCKINDYKHLVFRSTDRMGQANKLLGKIGFAEKERYNFEGIEIKVLMLNL